MEIQGTSIQLPEKNDKSIFSNMRAAHVGLRTTDYEGLIAWYIEKLEFRLIKKFSAGDLKLAFLAPANDDNFWIEILSGGVVDTHQEPTLPIISGFQHFCLDVKSVDETLSELRKRDVKVAREPFNVPAIAKRCGFISDPQGNVIEFTESIY
jgi:lactoylglutathione lyase